MGLYALKMKLDIQRFAAKLELDCDDGSHSTSNNTSNLYVTITAKRTSGSTYWSDEKKGTVTCDGESKSFYLSLPSNKSSNSTEVKFSNIEHHSDGTKTVKVSASITPGPSIGTLSDSMSYELVKIERGTRIKSFSVVNLTGFDSLNKLQVNYSTEDTVDKVWYSLNGGGWIELPSNNIISNLTPNTGYNIKIRVRRKSTGITTDSGSAYATTISQAYFTSGFPNISNGNSLRVIAKNPSGSKCKFTLQCPIGTDRITKDGTDATFTVDEINSMLQYINAQTERIRVYVITSNADESISYNNYIDGTYTVIDSEPIFNHFEYEDVDEKTLSLTGNNSNCIIGYSTIKATIPIANKATSKNYATMNKYRLSIGQDSVDVNYSDTNDVSMQLQKAKSGTFTVFAIDSRGFSTSVNQVANEIINYSNMTKDGEAQASRVNSEGETIGASEYVKLTLNGYMWYGNFGQVNNSIKSLKLRYKIANSTEWSEWYNADATKVQVQETGRFQYSELIKGDTDQGFNQQNSYNIEAMVSDELSSVSFSANIGSSTPHLCWDKNGMGIMGKYDTAKGGLLQVGSKPIETIMRETMALFGVGSRCKDVSNGNWNTSCNNETGFYMGSNMANAPTNSTGWWYVINMVHNNIYHKQLAFNFFEQEIYTRFMNNGNWSAWEQVGGSQPVTLFSGESLNDVYYASLTQNYKYVEVIVYHKSNDTLFSSGKLKVSDIVNHRLNFHSDGDSVKYFCEIIVYDTYCHFRRNEDASQGSSKWTRGNSFYFARVYGYKS